MPEGVIKELDSIEAVRQKYTMFISSKNRAQLVIEAIANACDEALAGFCSKIDVFCKKNESNESIWYIRDNGRGIPLSTDNNTDGIISIATKLYSGGKYDNEIYKVSAGVHGLGTLIINSLSKQLIITTLAKDKDNNHWRYFFKNGKFITKQLIKLRTSDNSLPYSTEIQFIINDDFFDNKDAPPIDLSCIERELMFAKHILKDTCSIRFNGNFIIDSYYEEFKGNSNNFIELITSSYKNKTTE